MPVAAVSFAGRADRQLGVEQGHLGQHGLAAAGDFGLGLVLGDHGEDAYLRPRSGRRRDGDERQRRKRELVEAHIVLQRPGMGGKRRRHLGGVDRAAAAQRHQHVRLLGLDQLGHSLDRAAARVLGNLVEGRARDAGLLQDLLDPTRHSKLSQAGIGDEDRPGAAVGRNVLRQGAQGAKTAMDVGRDRKEIKCQLRIHRHAVQNIVLSHSTLLRPYGSLGAQAWLGTHLSICDPTATVSPAWFITVISDTERARAVSTSLIR